MILEFCNQIKYNQEQTSQRNVELVFWSHPVRENVTRMFWPNICRTCLSPVWWYSIDVVELVTSRVIHTNRECKHRSTSGRNFGKIFTIRRAERGEHISELRILQTIMICILYSRSFFTSSNIIAFIRTFGANRE